MDGEMRRLRRRNCATGIGNKNKVGFKEMTGIQRVVKKAGRTSAGKKKQQKIYSSGSQSEGPDPFRGKIFFLFHSLFYFILFVECFEMTWGVWTLDLHMGEHCRKTILVYRAKLLFFSSTHRDTDICVMIVSLV